MIVNPYAMPSDAMTQEQVQSLNGAYAAGKVTATPTGQVLRVPKRAGSALLSPTVALDGQPAAGETIIRQLIKELGHCQEQLAACLPDANAPRQEVGGVDGKAATDEGQTVATSSGAVHALVIAALQAHDDHIAMLQAESTHLREQIEQVTARRREFLDFLQDQESRP